MEKLRIRPRWRRLFHKLFGHGKEQKWSYEILITSVISPDDAYRNGQKRLRCICGEYDFRVPLSGVCFFRNGTPEFWWSATDRKELIDPALIIYVAKTELKTGREFYFKGERI